MQCNIDFLTFAVYHYRSSANLISTDRIYCETGEGMEAPRMRRPNGPLERPSARKRKSMWRLKLAVSLFAVGQLASRVLASDIDAKSAEHDRNTEPTALIFSPDTLVTASTTPKLSISYDQSDLIIAWPSSAADWILEQSPPLDSGIPWTCVPLIGAQTNATNVSIAVSPGMQNAFYRLRKPIP